MTAFDAVAVVAAAVAVLSSVPHRPQVPVAHADPLRDVPRGAPGIARACPLRTHHRHPRGSQGQRSGTAVDLGLCWKRYANL